MAESFQVEVSLPRMSRSNLEIIARAVPQESDGAPLIRFRSSDCTMIVYLKMDTNNLVVRKQLQLLARFFVLRQDQGYERWTIADGYNMMGTPEQPREPDYDMLREMAFNIGRSRE